MKNTILKFATLSALPAAMLFCASCAIKGKQESNVTETVTAAESADGVIIVDTMTTLATVTDIDQGRRKVTLMWPSGTKSIYTCGPEIVNFKQIQIGDKVRATVTEEAAIVLGKGAPASAMVGTGIALAPVGSKPGGVVVDTAQATVKITAVDAAARQITIQFADGATKKVRVGKKADLSTVRVGEDITVQVSEGLAISVQKQ